MIIKGLAKGLQVQSRGIFSSSTLNIQVKPCNFCLRTWGNAVGLQKFYPKSNDKNFEISSLYFKNQMVFPFNPKCQACKRERP